MDSISINKAGISLAFVPEDRIGMGLSLIHICHMNIAGAQVKASPDEVERMLKDIIDQEYQEENTK